MLADPERPVLVVLREVRRPRAPLADDVEVLARPEIVDLDPGFERDRVAVGKVEQAIGPIVLHGQVRSAAIEPDRGVARPEVGKLRRAWAGHVAVHPAVRAERRRLLGAEFPSGHGRPVGPTHRAGERQEHQADGHALSVHVHVVPSPDCLSFGAV
jgi:hypothetical protein